VIDVGSSFRHFGYGILLTGFAALVSSCVAFLGFHRPYYLAVMLPVFTVFYLLLAWLVYLRRTAFLSLGRLQGRGETPRRGHGVAGDLGSLPEDKASGAELLGSRDESGLVRRWTEGPEAHSDRSMRDAVAVLVWSVCQLAVLSVALYHWLGLGATYY
jgi:hypothetical protein